jgi:DNA-binding response OmpR family regulator
MRVLLVEDEQPLAGYIATGLRKHGCGVDVAFDGRLPWTRPSWPPTTWSCWIATCR